MNSRKSIDLTHPMFTSYPQATALLELERIVYCMETIADSAQINSSRLRGAIERIHSTVERLAQELHTHATQQIAKGNME